MTGAAVDTGDDMPARPGARARLVGEHCGWAYCTKWGSQLVEQATERDKAERMWVCLTHVLHAEVRGWTVVRQIGGA